MLSKQQQLGKRIFDFIFSLLGLLLLFLPILSLIFFSTISTRQFGLFIQQRIGQFGKVFYMYKIRTMQKHHSKDYITLQNDKRITKFGKFLRKSKLDELPQLFNVLIGDMSFVGPRPDVIGYADRLTGDDAIILSVKPGITGKATLKYRNEEELLAKKENPKEFNDAVIWNDKIEINKAYILNWSFFDDIKTIFQTIFR